MYHYMSGGDWFSMVPMLLLWILVLGAALYGAVRLANRNPH